MTVGLASGVKQCCKCGRDLTGAQRMKDSEGRYWCMPCGEADKQRIMGSAGGICSGCGDSYAMTSMTELSGLPWCEKCLKRRYQKDRHGMGKRGTRASGLSVLKGLKLNSGGQPLDGRTKMMIGMMILLAGASAACYFFIF